jgi:heme-degrading monooxygenase HmoA
MIARLWRGVVAVDKAEAYVRYLADFGFRDYRMYAGHIAAYLLQRRVEGRVHVLLISFWESREAIAAYAGDDIERAHYYAYDLECLIDPARNVEHYEVCSADSLPRI